MKKSVAIIFGGKSAEHEVSLNSAVNIYNALDKNLFEPILLGVSKTGTWYQFKSADVFKKYKSLLDQELHQEEQITLISDQAKPWIYSLKSNQKKSIDCAFPIIHGTMGEDGTLQGFFRILNIPFVGCSVLGSALGMDKEYMKKVMSAAGIANSKYVVLKKNSAIDYNSLVKNLGSPFFIKPANAGSSVGVHKIKSESEFQIKLKDAFQYDHKVLAEEFMQGREIECSVMGLNDKPKASLPGEVLAKHEFYSYDAKYIDQNGADIVIPARLSDTEIKNIQTIAVKTFQELNCDGLARVDFFVKADGQIYVNEINTLPGFTQISMYPKMWEASGLAYKDLITELIHLAFAKNTSDNQLKLSF